MYGYDIWQYDNFFQINKNAYGKFLRSSKNIFGRCTEVDRARY